MQPTQEILSEQQLIKYKTYITDMQKIIFNNIRGYLNTLGVSDDLDYHLCLHVAIQSWLEINLAQMHLKADDLLDILDGMENRIVYRVCELQLEEKNHDHHH